MAAAANPYQEFLGEREPIAVLQSTVSEIEAMTSGLTPEQLAENPAPGKWSIHEIVAHMADIELVFSARTRWMAFEDQPTLIGFDQAKWTSGWKRESEPFEVTLMRFRMLRESQLRFFSRCTLEDMGRTGIHTERGRQTLGMYPPLLAGHDLNHLQQIERIRRRFAK
jgi:hypothetical protein